MRNERGGGYSGGEKRNRTSMCPPICAKLINTGVTTVTQYEKESVNGNESDGEVRQDGKIYKKEIHEIVNTCKSSRPNFLSRENT